MIEAIIDGREIQDRRQLHEVLAAQLHFPEWYGKNLDALYDCLPDIHEETVIRLLNLEELDEHLGDYTERFYRVISRAEADTPWLHLSGKENHMK